MNRHFLPLPDSESLVALNDYLVTPITSQWIIHHHERLAGGWGGEQKSQREKRPRITRSLQDLSVYASRRRDVYRRREETEQRQETAGPHSPHSRRVCKAPFSGLESYFLVSHYCSRTRCKTPQVPLGWITHKVCMTLLLKRTKSGGRTLKRQQMSW